MAKGGPDRKSANDNSDLMDKDINFDNRDMHKTWPFVKGCLLLFAGVAGLIILCYYVFKVYDFNKMFS